MMPSTPTIENQDGLDLRSLCGLLLHYKWLVLLCLLIGAMCGSYLGSRGEQRPEYKASTLVKIGKKGQGFYPTGVLEEKTFAEEIEIARSRAFLERVAQRLKQEIEVLSVNPPRLHKLAQLKAWLLGYSEVARPAMGKGAPVTLRDVHISPDALSGVYTLTFTNAHTFVISPAGQEESRPGELGRRFSGWGFNFTVMGGPVAAQTQMVMRVRNLEEVVATLGGSLVFVPLKETNLLRISTTAYNPERAKECVQVAVEEFMAFGRLHSEQEAAQSLAYMTQQLEVVQNNIEDYLGAVRDFKEQHPLAALSEDPHALIDQRSSHESELRKELRKVQERVGIAQALLAAIDSHSEENAMGSTMLNQATLMSNDAVIDEVRNLLGLEEEQRTQGAKYFIFDPANSEIESKARRAHKRLREHVSALLFKYQRDAALLQKILDEFTAQLQRLPALEEGLGRLTRRLKVYQDIYTYLTQRREETQIARTTEATYTITVIDPPYVSPVPQSTKKLQTLIMGLLLGLASGVGLALLRERLDLSLKSVQDVERSLGLPVFGAIPAFGEQYKEPALAGVDPHLVLLSQPQASAAEGYRILRTNIHFAEPDTQIKTLVISSALEGEGKSVSVANLAVAISQTGRKTLLVDADLRRPTQHSFFHLEREPGLSDVLVGNTSWQEAVQATDVEGLFLLPCGKLPPNPAELLGSARMGKLLAELGQEYEQILLDSPPLLAVADSALLASKCDRMLLVVRAHQTPKEPIERALVALSTVHASVMGVVFNAMDVKRNYQYCYYYNYEYTYNEGQVGAGKKPRRLFGLLR